MVLISVPKEEAQKARLSLSDLALVDKARKIVEEGGFVIIPLLGEPPEWLIKKFSGFLSEGEAPERELPTSPFNRIESRVQETSPETPVHLLPDKWEKIGDVVCLRMPSLLKNSASSVAEAYAKVLGARAVVDYGDIHGIYRTPTARILWGPEDSEELIVTHLENGILYTMDVLSIMFSSGNIDERVRMSTIECSGETIVDMFAGIGYFTLPLAAYGKPERIFAYEINPRAYGFLKENSTLNRVENIVYACNSDNRDCPEAIADRIIMGYVGTTHLFLKKAMSILKEEGGWIHYHETCPNELIPKRPLSSIGAAAREKGFREQQTEWRIIKSYSPGVSHVVVDIFLSV